MAAVVAAIRKGKSFVVATHRNPDGDALGSALALAEGLRNFGKTARVYNADPVPYFLKFLPGWEKVTADLGSDRPFDAAFIVDCSELGRVGEAFRASLRLGTVIVLDHHARARPEGDLRLIDPEAASSGVVVHRVLRRLGVRITPAIATNLYVTLATDTGNFRYANTSAEVLQLAADLVRAGARPDRISRALDGTAPPEKLKLLAQVLGTLELFEDGRIGAVTVTERMLQDSGGSLEMVDDFVDYPRSLATVEIAALFREAPEGWRVSLRSKESADVGAVAANLGGGGHVRAAGFTLAGEEKTVKEKTLAALRSALQASSAKSPVYKRKTAC